jgi:GTPase SAR1 family protein
MIQILKQVKQKKKIFFKIIKLNLDLQYQCIIDGQEYDLTIIDNAGSDQYTLNHIDFENSDAYILVYAIDDIQRFLVFIFIFYF